MCEKSRFYVGTIVGLLLVVVGSCGTAQAKVIYVDAAAAGANNGSSWTDAYNYLQDALADADVSQKPVTVRVAQGIYRPDEGAAVTRGDHGATFQLINGVTIQGGYAGVGEPDPDLRNIDVYQSVLSGDLNGDDVEPEDLARLHRDPSRSDNSCQIVSGSFTDQTAMLDGVTIAGGHQDSRTCREIAEGGAGMTIESGSPTIIGCTFTGNAGHILDSVLATRSGSAVTLIDCTFSRNQGRNVVENKNSSLVVARCTFSHNSDTAIRSRGDSYLVVTDCAFAYNEDGVDISFGGGASLTNCTFEHHREAFSSHGDVELTDCTFEHNSRHAIDHSSGNLQLTGCMFRHNTVLFGAAIKCWQGELNARKCRFIGNVSQSWGGAIKNIGTSSAFQDCEFSGNTAPSGGAIQHSGGWARFVNCVFHGNLAKEGRGGAIFAGLTDLTVQNCTFSGNSAADIGSALCSFSSPRIKNCIFRDNGIPAIGFVSEEPLVSYSNVEGGWPGEGNIDVDPGFVEPGFWDANGTHEDANDDFWVGGDYHLLSEAGRWDRETESWVRDAATSPCIDAGDPNSPIGTESFPNGGRPNMGAYGAGEEASRTFFGEPVCETILAGDINGDCLVDFNDLAIVMSQWMMNGEDFINKPPILRILEPADGDQVVWPGPTTFCVDATDPDGTVHRVSVTLQHSTEYRQARYTFGLSDIGNGQWRGHYTWRDDIAEGAWTVCAQATDNDGAKTNAPEIVIHLYSP
ncbi:MAG: right-handed parallel beta-helix repeat-containing protein [Planctomycetota bacterium]|jgi:predicted outer membrane repeat protein